MNGTGIAVASLLARGAHLVFFLLVGNRLGANAGTDTVFLLYAPLAVISSVAAGVAETVVMPVLHRAMERDCAAGLHWRLAGRLLLVVAPAAALALLVGWSLAPGAPGTAAILLLLPPLAALSAVFTGVLNANDRYLSAVLAPFWGGILASLATWLGPREPATLVLALLAFEVGRFGALSIRLPQTAAAASGAAVADLLGWATRRGLLQAIANLLAALNPLIAMLFARGLGAGAVTCVEYSGRLWNLVYALFFGHLLLAFAAMSRQAAAGCLERRTVHQRALRFGAVALVLSIAGVLGSSIIIELLYGGGAMEPEMRARLASLLGWYLAGAGPYIAGMVYVRALSAEGRTGVLTAVATFGVMFFPLITAPLVAWVGLDGVGLATSTVNLANAMFLAGLYHRGNRAERGITSCR